MIKESIIKLTNNQDLTNQETFQTIDEIMSGEASDIQISSFLTALAMKGETIDEITSAAKAMRSHAQTISPEKEVLEIVGTGGDGSNSFNISTTSAIVISSAGVPIAKHGNRSASSKCGAADVLEELGVNINLSPEKNLELLNEINICFLFAQKYHSAMKHVAPVRGELAIRTIFNILGPLTNPAKATTQVLGVFDESLVESLAKVLQNLGVKRGMVVYGQDRLDEISVCDKTTVCEIKGNELLSYEISPQDFGIQLANKEDLVGGDPSRNAEITLNILKGEKSPKRDAVILNSAAGLYVSGKVNSLKEGVQLATELIDSGKALQQLERFIKYSNE